MLGSVPSFSYAFTSWQCKELDSWCRFAHARGGTEVSWFPQASLASDRVVKIKCNAFEHRMKLDCACALDGSCPCSTLLVKAFWWFFP